MIRSSKRLTKWCRVMLKNKVRIKRYRKIEKRLEFYALIDIKIGQLFQASQWRW